MLAKKCARCMKTVYPIEELKCLDKVWHKQCFKCQECGMTLSMSTYKGFNRLPYCNAHVPHATYTTVLDTPEARRLAENTKLQSNIKYHEEYEKSKGRVMQMADDPEALRSGQDSSPAVYGDRKRSDSGRLVLNGDVGSGTPGLDNHYEPMTPRAGGNHPKLYELYGSSNVSIPRYQLDDNAFSFGPKFNATSLGDYEIYSPMGTLRRTKSCKAPSNTQNDHGQTPAYKPLSPAPTFSQPSFTQQISHQETRPPLHQQLSQSAPEPQSPQLPFEDDRMPRPGQSQFAAALNALKRNAPPQSFGFGNSQQPSQPTPAANEPMLSPQMSAPQQTTHLQNTVQPSAPAPTVQSHPTSYEVPKQQATPQPFKFQGFQRQQQQPQLQPMYQSPSLTKQQQQQQQQYQNSYTTNHRPQQQQSYTQQTPSVGPPQQSISATKFRPSPQHGRCFVALYDYMAGDIDEVTFCEGDVIVNGEPVEGGWMIGTVLRNGQRGMLPANYVENAA